MQRLTQPPGQGQARDACAASAHLCHHELRLRVVHHERCGGCGALLLVQQRRHAAAGAATARL